MLIALEGHGREEQVVPGADLVPTLGWFTSVFPVRLDPGESIGPTRWPADRTPGPR